MPLQTRFPMRNVLMTLEFVGTNYVGWQTQAKGESVQTILENCVKKILGKRSPILASGRTDAGVHALALPVSVRGHFPMDDAALVRALNSMLPMDIAVRGARTMPEDFNALKNAKWKKYAYLIYNSPIRSPFHHRSSWHIIQPLDLKGMREGGRRLAGKHDFASFMGRNAAVKSTVRDLKSVKIKKSGGVVVIEVIADGFLKQMVRNIAGTLVEIGRGRMKPSAIKGILAAKDRRKAGPTAPAQGLLLVEVGY